MNIWYLISCSELLQQSVLVESLSSSVNKDVFILFVWVSDLKLDVSEYKQIYMGYDIFAAYVYML